MKKTTITAITLAISILFTSCANTRIVPKNIDELIACFGQDKANILGVMNLTEQDAKEEIVGIPEHPERFPIKQRQKILGEEFRTNIIFHMKEKTVYGLEYFKNYTDVEHAFEFVKKIDKQLSSAYEVDLGFVLNPISDVVSLEAFTEISRTYGTHWVYKDNINVVLTVDVNLNPSPDVEINVSVWLRFVEINREKYLPKIYN